MLVFVNLNSNKTGEIDKFLSKFYNTNLDIKENYWKKTFKNPVEIAELIGTYIDNKDIFDLNLWISFDPGILIKIDDSNGNDIIKYLYERFPY